MSIMRGVEMDIEGKQELIRRTLVEDVQKRTIARVAMQDCIQTIRLYEAKLEAATLDTVQAERILDEHLLDYADVMGMGELPLLERHTTSTLELAPAQGFQEFTD